MPVVLGRRLEDGGELVAGERRGVDGLLDLTQGLRALGTEAVDGARVGADEQASPRSGQAVRRAVHLRRPGLLTRAVHGDHLPLAAGDRRAAGQDERLVALRREAPTGGRGNGVVDLLDAGVERVRRLLLAGGGPSGSLECLPVAGKPGGEGPALGFQLGELRGVLVADLRDLLVECLELFLVLADRCLALALGAAGGAQGACLAEPLVEQALALQAVLRVSRAVEGRHLAAVEGDDRVVGQRDPMGVEPSALGARALVVGEHLLGARDDLAAGQRRRGAADAVAEVCLVEQLAALAIVGGRWHAAHRDEEPGLRGQQIALRRDAALGRPAPLVVAPQELAVVSIDRIQVDPLRRENPRGEVRHPAVHQHARPHGPQRDHLPAAQHLAIVRRRAEAPDLRAVARRQAVDDAVVRADVEAPPHHRRRQPHRAEGGEAPAHLPRRHVDGVDFPVRRRTEVERPASHHGVERRVEAHAGPLDEAEPAADLPRIRLPPRRLRPVRGTVDPARGERRPDRLRRDAAARDIVAVRRPVGGQRPRGYGHRRHPRHCSRPLSHRRVLQCRVSERCAASSPATDLPDSGGGCPGRTPFSLPRGSPSPATPGGGTSPSRMPGGARRASRRAR